MSDAVAVRAYAREHAISPNTLRDAVHYGHIRRVAGGISRASADAWFEHHEQRAELRRDGTPARNLSLAAQALALGTEIQTLQRELRELRTATCRRDAAEAAHGRRLERLRAAVAAFPQLYTREAAQALQRPPEAVHAALCKFAERPLAELPEVPGRTGVEKTSD